MEVSQGAKAVLFDGTPETIVVATYACGLPLNETLTASSAITGKTKAGESAIIHPPSVR